MREKQQIVIAQTLFDLGMSLEIIEQISGVSSEELFWQSLVQQENQRKAR